MAKEKKYDVCERCCDFYHTYHEANIDPKTEDGKLLAPVFLKEYEELMVHVLEEEFEISGEPAERIVETLGYGNWERLWETDEEAAKPIDELKEDFIGDIFYCSDRWTWDRVLRVNWLYQVLKKRCGGNL